MARRQQRARTGGADVATVHLPGRRRDPVRTLLQRFAAASAIVFFVALLTYAGREGYRDITETPLTFVDALYYATVSVTTTGYGDIVPVSEGARLITTFIVTPARVVFLILLVGTTIEILTETTRRQWSVRRWRERMTEHTLICGYGAKGRAAAATMLGDGVPASQIVVIEPDDDRRGDALALGLAVVDGNATQTTTLQEALIEDAAAVIVAVGSDDTAVLITLTAREANPRVRIAAAVRESENVHLLRQSGADHVVESTGASGRLLGISTTSPALVGVLEDLLNVGHGLELTERLITEADACAMADADDQVIVVLRDGERLLWNDPEADPLRPGDRVVELHGSPEFARRGRPVSGPRNDDGPGVPGPSELS